MTHHAVILLQLDGVYTKSAQGRDELAQHASTLPRQLRAVQALVERGLIEEVAGLVVARIEKSEGSPQRLAGAVENCHKLIRLTIDEKIAEQFRAAARRILIAEA